MLQIFMQASGQPDPDGYRVCGARFYLIYDSRGLAGSANPAKSNLRLVPPATENGTVLATKPPRRPPNRELREREHLTDAEVEQLVEAARDNRYCSRDALMVLMAYRHGLRASEVVHLKWEQVDFERGELHVNRLKGGVPATHPLSGRELRELRNEVAPVWPDT